MRLAIVLAVALLLPHPSAAESDDPVRRAIDRALPMLQSSASTFVELRSCFSCHHNALPILMLHLAKDRGIRVDDAVLRAVEAKTFRVLNQPAAFDEAVQGSRVSDPTPNDALLLMAADAAGTLPSLTLAVMANRIRGWQAGDGHWMTSDFRPPHSSSNFTATATAVRAMRAYVPAELSQERDEAFNRARAWLWSARPQSTEDASFRVMGLAWAHATLREQADASRELFARQMPNGGWPQLPGYVADAYSTGEALVALREAGVAASDTRWRRGLHFLLSTQAKDGTWRVRTRMVSPAIVSPPYFETGFPYRKDQFLSYAASCWATMALLRDLPVVAGSSSGSDGEATTASSAPGGPLDAPSWARTALFGTSAALLGLLDGGLDPNSRTAGGTSLLMMAAPDAAKVKMLLARGAKVSERAMTSGADALTIAASYGGTSSSVDLLLAAGAEAQPPGDRTVRHAPLLFASMVGEVGNVARLLAHGADPNGGPRATDTPVSSAVTFGHADVLRLLVEARASVSMTERTGINLLHWATIANRASVIPVLAQAGVPLNAVDDNSFTPLMYAATIDFGDAETLRALVRAGANPAIRNDKHRTARQQARYFRHAQLEAGLR